MKNETAAKLNTLSPIMVEPMPLSLEEVFLDEMEGTNYDFSKILLKTNFGFAYRTGLKSNIAVALIQVFYRCIGILYMYRLRRCLKRSPLTLRQAKLKAIT